MAYRMILKRCCTCKAVKPRRHFSKCRTRKDGYFDQCKACKASTQKKYRNTERGREKHNADSRRRQHTEHGRSSARGRNAKYRMTSKWKIRYQELKRTEKYKAQKIKSSKYYYATHPQQVKARRAIFTAIRYHGFPRASSQPCQQCGKTANLYHHHKGYVRTHWLAVIPVCRKCHIAIHKLAPSNF